MTRHFCYDVGRHVSDQCFGTPASATTLLLCGKTRSDQCFRTPTSTTTLLLRGQACSDKCFGTPALCYDTSVLYSTYEYLLCCVLLIFYYWSRYSHSYMIKTRMTNKSKEMYIVLICSTYRYFCKNISSIVPTGTSE